MPTVTVEGVKSFPVQTGKKLVLGIEDAGIDILHRCGGNARCTTCKVKFVAGEPADTNPTERATLEEDGLLGTYRLSCQVRVGAEDMTVRGLKTATEAGITPGERPED